MVLELANEEGLPDESHDEASFRQEVRKCQVPNSTNGTNSTAPTSPCARNIQTVKTVE